MVPTLLDIQLALSERSCETWLVFQLLPACLASAFQLVKLPAAEGTVLELLFNLPSPFFFPLSSFTLYSLLFKQNGQMSNFFVFMLLGAYRGKGGRCLWARKARDVLSSLSLPPLHLRDLDGESPYLYARGALSMLCKHTLPLRLGCPSCRDLC